jgi:glycerate dehydrogenase
MIDRESIAKMKDGAMLINTSRGPLINEADLAAALRSGKLAGAAVDVVSSEPIRTDNPLLSAPNIIITPHIAWAPKESRGRLMDIAARNIKSFLDGNVENTVG